MQTPTWSHLSFGARLSEPATNALINLGVARVLQTSERLIRQGDHGRTVYLVLSGQVSATFLVENGAESLLGIRHPGDLIGEMALLGEGVRTATVTARERTTVLVIPPQAFLDYVADFPEVALAISRMTGDRLTQSNLYRADAAGYEVEVRLARALLYQCARTMKWEDGKLSVGLKQAELAKLIGAKEGTVHKALKSSALQHLIVALRGRILILDVPGLAKLAEMAVPEELT